MNKLVFRLALLFYVVYYFLIPGSVIYLFILFPNFSHINIVKYIPVVAMLICVLLLPIAIYRAKLASEIFFQGGNKKIMDTHNISKTMLRISLSYLPLIGFLFKSDGVE